MNSILTEETETIEILCPYGDLFIYYFEGILTVNEKFFGSDYLGNWEEDGFSFLFFSIKATEVVEKIQSMQPELVFIDEYNMTYDEWLGEKLTSQNIGNFTVSPTWDIPDKMFLPNFGALHIILDPGVVFGTGTHPTTHDCLDMIEMAFKKNVVKSVLDLGTGTGLLALAAAKYKCKKILAVDFNYLAVKTTLNNIRLNSFGDQIIAAQGLAQDFVNMPGDLLIANIHYDVMKDVIASPGFLEKKLFILSGLLCSQAKIVEEVLNNLPVEIIEKRSRNGVWFTFYGRIF